MTPVLLLYLAVVVLVTATLSGVFGMAGGMILMGALVWILPVDAAMMLHGVTQTASNGWRAFLHRGSIRWNVLGGYLLGSAAVLALFIALAFVPDRATVFLTLGALPFIAAAVPQRFALDVTKPGMASLCGFVVTGFQLAAGVSGPMLDVFYVKSPLTRHEIVASKAMTQTLGHLIKLGYYGLFVGFLVDGDPLALPWWVYVLSIVLAMAGAALGKRVLDAMSDHRFRQWSQIIIMAVGSVFIVRGLMLLA